MAAPEEGAKAELAAPDVTTALQRSRFPYLEQFAAQGRFARRGDDHPAAYIVAFGLRLGLATGKTLTLELPRNAPGTLLARMLRDAADAVQRFVEDCEKAGTDERALAPAELLNRMPAKGEACTLCDSVDPARFAICRRPGCPVARARGAAPILAPGALAQAVHGAYAGPAGINGHAVDARGHAFDPDCGCAACQHDKAERAANADDQEKTRH